ncbi:unnamed protein product, partial [Meganyctiphanes norvegica]
MPDPNARDFMPFTMICWFYFSQIKHFVLFHMRHNMIMYSGLLICANKSFEAIMHSNAATVGIKSNGADDILLNSSIEGTAASGEVIEATDTTGVVIAETVTTGVATGDRDATILVTIGDETGATLKVAIDDTTGVTLVATDDPSDTTGSPEIVFFALWKISRGRRNYMSIKHQFSRQEKGVCQKVWKYVEQKKIRQIFKIIERVFFGTNTHMVLSRKVTRYWRKPRHYPDDPYAPYHKRENFRLANSRALKYL